MFSKKIVYVGVDVDDTAFHGADIILETGELFEFKRKPDHGVLHKKLNELIGDRYEMHLCYEACYLGYSLYGFLRKAGIHCHVIASSLIPVKAGARVKTDSASRTASRRTNILKQLSETQILCRPSCLDCRNTTIKFICRYALYFSPTGQVKFCGCARAGVYLIAWCRMSWQFDLMRRLVVQASSVLQKIVVD